MYRTTKALILRYAPYGDTARVLTVLDESGEKLTVTAHGKFNAVQLYSCAELTLRTSRGRLNIAEARTIAEFRGVRSSIDALNLAAHTAKTLERIADSDVPEPALFRLGAKMLNAVSEGTRPLPELQAAFEQRAATLAGFANFAELEIT
ncbi:MAG: hypothetical protein LBN97_02110 [Oscillospiraceae bacterium]|jgi:recombinational DNA repair protein (RecF pathway)|nr:hypothetical protein [Oscillospiraceae bacterium]